MDPLKVCTEPEGDCPPLPPRGRADCCDPRLPPCPNVRRLPADPETAAIPCLPPLKMPSISSGEGIGFGFACRNSLIGIKGSLSVQDTPVLSLRLTAMVELPDPESRPVTKLLLYLSTGCDGREKNCLQNKQKFL
jgi:hypothetical protein